MTEQTTPEEFLTTIEDETRRADCTKIHQMMSTISGWEAKMWGPCLIGYSSYKYKYPSGHSGETFRIGFANRKAQITLHVLWYPDKKDPLLAQLGKHKVGKGCLYIKRLSDVDESILEAIISRAVTEFGNRHEVTE
ncbi:DUF1801 domain-containing protein [Maritalea sp.]|uniref:DUF1801 domain-containing protein n=1 Tax=Maritalea sp. TaxID=2003361 RepID=UPI003EF8B8A4